MAEGKRKSETSSAVKRRYNQKTYGRLLHMSRKTSRRLSRINAPSREFRKRRLSKRQ